MCIKPFFINNYEWLISAIIAIIAILVTIFIAKKQIKKSKNTSFFNDKFELYTLFTKYFDGIIDKDFSGIYKLENLIANPENPFFNNVKLSKIKYLFNNEIYEQIMQLSKECNTITELKQCLDKVYDYIISSGYFDKDVSHDFAEVVQGLEQGNEQITEETLKKYSNMCIVRNKKLCSSKARDYNYYDIYIEKKGVIESFKNKYLKVIEDIKKLLKL